MIDEQDIVLLQQMRQKYQGAATSINEAKASAIAEVEEKYKRALAEVEEKRIKMIAQIENRSVADEKRINQFLGQLNSCLGFFGAKHDEPGQTNPA